MKYIKILGLLAVTVGVLMLGASSSSATSLTSPTGETPTIQAVSSHIQLHQASLGVTITCGESTKTITTTGHGVGAPVTGSYKFTLGKCNHHVTVLKNGTGSLINTATTGNGTLTSSGAEVTLQATNIGISCLYKTNNTHIGTLTGGTPAVLKIESALIPRTGHSAFCGSSAQLTGQYTVSHPSSLSVH